MKVLSCVHDNGIGEVANLGGEETDDVIPDDLSPFLSEPSPREMAEVTGEVPDAGNPLVPSSAVFTTAPTGSLALSPLASTLLSQPPSLSYCILSPHLADPAGSLHVRFLSLLDRRALPPKFLRCSCRRSDWSATTRKRFCWTSCVKRE